ncbi:MAG: succinyl-diaminopimelate desuccinylase [Rickettsiales bacterium]|jgi:succinyl-diaminopimelate desuccinylase
MYLDSVKLSQELIKHNSPSGANLPILEFLANVLANFGFKNDILGFDGDGSYPVINLHSIYNPKDSKNMFYFAGHTDIVPEGDEKLWTHPPFEAKIVDGILHGRGAVDMKPAIAAFAMAAANFIRLYPKADFGIGLLITGDEEADGVNGTRKILQWLKKNNMPISACIVGEPTNPNKLGEMIKVGRRGSVSFELKIIGKQGHIAYPENFDNPNTTITNVLKLLKDHKLDSGNQFFDPSNLEVTNIQTSNVGGNVVPEDVKANFNIRFNDEHTSQSLIEWVKYVCDKSAGKHELTTRVSGESFITKPGILSDCVAKAVKKETGLDPELSTTGGTSDARFIKDYCPVVECGLINKTAHQIDENIATIDIQKLEKIYYSILENYAQR